MKPAFFTRSANTEKEASAVFYEEKQAGLAIRFLHEIQQAVQQIRQHPEAWPKRDNHHRKCHLQNFPYSLIYRIEEEKIFIVAVMHHRRHPDSWRIR